MTTAPFNFPHTKTLKHFAEQNPGSAGLISMPFRFLISFSFSTSSGAMIFRLSVPGQGSINCYGSFYCFRKPKCCKVCVKAFCQDSPGHETQRSNFLSSRKDAALIALGVFLHALGGFATNLALSTVIIGAGNYLAAEGK